MNLKKLFLWWAYLDIGHTGEIKSTYFGRYADEIGIKNLKMIRSLSVFFSIICVYVFVSTFTYFEKGEPLRKLYLIILITQAAAFAVSTVLIQRKTSSAVYNILSSLYLLEVLALGSYIGTYFSVYESAAIFLVVLILSQIIFILPPVVTTVFSALATAATLVISYQIKDVYYFESDIINCVGVFILSVLLGFLINKIRAEEAFARSKVLELNNELKQISVTDQLTALPNHRGFQDTYYKLFEASRATGTRIGVIMLDIDKFKPYNDNYGHIKGDKCLHTIGLALKKLQKENVHIYRFGGEEFIALLNDCGCIQETTELMCSTIEQLAIPHEFSSVSKVVTVSAGFHTGIPGKNEMPMSFVDKADRAMYQSKTNGGNMATFFKA